MDSDKIACILISLFSAFCLTVCFTYSIGWTIYHSIIMFLLSVIIYKIIH